MVAGHLRNRNSIWYLSMSYTDAHGKKKSVLRSTGIPVEKGNKKKAEKLLLEARQELQKQLDRGDPDTLAMQKGTIMFTAFLSDWLDMMRSSVEVTTFSAYQTSVKKKIIPYFDENYPKLRLVDLTPKMIQDYYTYEINVNHLTTNTVIHRHANIRKALQYAFQIGLLDFNPADRVSRPKKNTFESEPYNRKELEVLFEKVRGNPLEFGVIMAAFYGLRREEVVGLKWNAVDFENKTIAIKSVVTAANVDGKQILVKKNTAKTKSSLRTLPLVPPIEELLLKMKKAQEAFKDLCGNSYSKEYLEYVYLN